MYFSYQSDIYWAIINVALFYVVLFKDIFNTFRVMSPLICLTWKRTLQLSVTATVPLKWVTENYYILCHQQFLTRTTLWMMNIQNFTYVIFYSYLLRIYFVQEYIYQEIAGRVVYVFLRKINVKFCIYYIPFCFYENTIFYYIPYYGFRICFNKREITLLKKPEQGISH